MENKTKEVWKDKYFGKPCERKFVRVSSHGQGRKRFKTDFCSDKIRCHVCRGKALGRVEAAQKIYDKNIKRIDNLEDNLKLDMDLSLRAMYVSESKSLIDLNKWLKDNFLLEVK